MKMRIPAANDAAREASLRSVARKPPSSPILKPRATPVAADARLQLASLIFR